VSSVFCFFLFFSLFFFISSSSKLFPLGRTASVATLPSALLVERWTLGASWVYFHFNKSSIPNRTISLSMSLAPFWHSLIPFDGLVRFVGKKIGIVARAARPCCGDMRRHTQIDRLE
jgi:hypothetical protein